LDPQHHTVAVPGSAKGDCIAVPVTWASSCIPGLLVSDAGGGDRMIGFWASCVSRDTFELGGIFEGDISYHARSSWISQATPETEQLPTTAPEGQGFPLSHGAR
jgi:hypothetical protein